MQKHTNRVLSLVLSLLLVIGLIPTTAFAAVDYNHDSSPTADGYYNVVSKKDWSIAPGIDESEIVLNNDLGTRRQVAHIMVADTTNEYVKVTTSYTDMDTSVFATSNMMLQATAAKEKLGWNVVGAMNTCLSWYTGYPAEHYHEPLGFMMIDGETVWDLTQMYGNLGFPTCVVIYRDDRPADMPKVEMKSITGTQDLNGYEEQVIPCSSGFIVKNGVNSAPNPNHDPQNTGSAPRSVVGVTADGKVVIMENDGRQAISLGMTMYECAEMMLDLGCVYACNCDGGGSSTFLSKRPGAELATVNSPSDGSLRETTSGILFVSTVPSDGQFAIAHISAEDKYYSPGSEVPFSVIGTDYSGNAVDIPEETYWQLKEADMGTISADGLFISNGTTGTATAQMVYNDKVVGEASVEIVVPEIAFTASNFSVKYGTSAELTLVATTNNGVNEVVMKPGDYVITCDNADIGTIDGTTFTAVDADHAPANQTGNLTASLSFAPEVTAAGRVVVCREITETIFSFDGQSDDWMAMEINGEGTYAWLGKNYTISDAGPENGQVRYGDGSMKLNTNQLNAKILTNGGSKDYYQLVLMPKESVVLHDVQSYGVWVYLDDEMYAHEFNMRYIVDANNDGVFDTIKSYSPIGSRDIYQNQEESGWYYLKVNVGGQNILIAGADINSRDDVANNLKTKALPMNCRTIHILGYPHTAHEILRSGVTVNGNYNLYFDDFTVDYAADVADRVAPKFGSITLLSATGADDKDLSYGRTKNDKAFEPLAVTDTDDNTLDVTANVSDDGDGLDGTSAKAYVDGKLIPSTYANGKISISGVAVAQGIHRVKFEIADRAGNKQTAVRLVNVTSAADASTIVVEPKDPTLDKLACGSVYWMDLKATDIETIQSVSATIDINSSNHWELDHAEIANGFSYTYAVNKDNNTADITITRTGENYQTGEAVIASLPIRIISFADDIQYPGKNEQTYWTDTTINFWSHNLSVDVDRGEIEYVADYAPATIGTFSNGSFSVETEMYLPQNYMIADNNEYFTSHGSLHVHDAQAIADKPASCTESGYTGRTYCDVCDSVVDWGTVLPAAGHVLDASVNGLQTCGNCGEKFFFENGAPKTGWIEDGGAIYYGKNDGSLADGAYTVDGHTYTFTDCVLTRGAWETDAEGYKTCFWAGEQCHDGWYTMNGKQYHFHGVWADTGVSRLGKGVGGYEYRIFDEETCEWLEDYTGLFIASNGVTYAENGIAVYHGLAKSDAGDYYYINSRLLAVKNCTYSISEAKTNGLLPAGKYQFDATGKMINPPVEPTPQPTDEPVVKSGLVHDEDGEVRYYVDGVAVYYGLVQDTDGSYYYINSTKKAVKDCTYGISEAKANGLLPAGKYQFDASGRMINPPQP